MRICVLSTSITEHQMGGTEVHAEMLAAEAGRQGHEVTLVTAAHPFGVAEERREGFTVRYLPGTDHSMSRRAAPAWWRESAAELSRMRAGGRLDVVWAENFAGLSYAALPAPARAPVISVVNGLALAGEISSNFNRVSSLPELAYFLTRYAAQTLFYYIPRFRAMVRDSDLLVGVSHQTVQALGREFPSSRSKTLAILNPVDGAVFRPDEGLRARSRHGFGLAEGDVAVLMAGVMHKQKGMDRGLRAFAAAAGDLPGARILLAGDGPEKARLLELSARLDLGGKAVFCGALGNASMPGVYNAADIFLNPTMRAEGLPMVQAEAMACGLPTVTTRIGGTASTIDDGLSGFFTDPGDDSGLAEKLRLLLRDGALRKTMGAAAREKALKDFDRRKAVGRYIEESRRLISGGRG